MKLIVDQKETYEKEAIITIQCRQVDSKLQKILTFINTQSNSVSVTKDNLSKQVPLDEVYYFESVDNKTYLYTQSEIYEVSSKLYELEVQLQETSFLRISKSCILNLDKLVRVKALLNAKYEGVLANEEKIIITRHYVAAFKEKLNV